MAILLEEIYRSRMKWKNVIKNKIINQKYYYDYYFYLFVINTVLKYKRVVATSLKKYTQLVKKFWK